MAAGAIAAIRIMRTNEAAKGDTAIPEDQEALQAYLEKQADFYDTDIETEKSVLATNFALAAEGEAFDLDKPAFPLSLINGISKVAEWLGGDIEYAGHWAPAMAHIHDLHGEMRANMIGPIFEQEHDIKFADPAAQTEYEQAMSGLHQAFIDLKDTTDGNEWTEHFEITEIEQDGQAPIITIAGQLDGTHFERCYVPNAAGDYDAAGHLDVTAENETGQMLRQRFTIDDLGNAAMTEAQGDPTPNQKPVYTPEHNIL